LKIIVENFIAEQALFRLEDRLLLAVSGGMDSMVMAHLLWGLGYSIGVVHCNFQLRGAASDADAQLVKSWAAQKGIPFYNKAFDTKEYAARHKCSTQMAARDLRYAFFADIRTLEGYDYLLTAHHLDDRLETFWLNFSRGTGWKGLAALQASTGYIRRPLLCVNRSQVADYQAEMSVPYREDESNAGDEYRRNAFRHQVLPALYAWEPDLADRMAANFNRLEQMYQIYSVAVRKELAELRESTENGLVFQRLALQQHPASETMMWELLSPYGFTAEDCRQALTAKSGTILSTDNWQLLIQKEQLLLQKKEQETGEVSYSWEAADSQLLLHSGYSLRKAIITKPQKLSKAANMAMISLRNLIYPLKVRRWLAGDSFCPLGMGGQHQKLQDFFTNNKIDRFSRQEQWLLVNGDGQIIWVVGLRLDERFKVSAQDVEILKVSFGREDEEKVI
jgi:tRNA(Ile)-lysidine synthase